MMLQVILSMVRGIGRCRGVVKPHSTRLVAYVAVWAKESNLKPHDEISRKAIRGSTKA